MRDTGSEVRNGSRHRHADRESMEKARAKQAHEPRMRRARKFFKSKAAREWTMPKNDAEVSAR